jgi:hypothetical protein
VTFGQLRLALSRGSGYKRDSIFRVDEALRQFVAKRLFFSTCSAKIQKRKENL